MIRRRRCSCCCIWNRNNGRSWSGNRYCEDARSYNSGEFVVKPNEVMPMGGHSSVMFLQLMYIICGARSKWHSYSRRTRVWSNIVNHWPTATWANECHCVWQHKCDAANVEFQDDACQKWPVNLTTDASHGWNKSWCFVGGLNTCHLLFDCVDQCQRFSWVAFGVKWELALWTDGCMMMDYGNGGPVHSGQAKGQERTLPSRTRLSICVWLLGM